jgi:hypothetical protein
MDFFPGLRFSHFFYTYYQPPIFFVIVADNKRCFLTYLQMWLPESDVRRIIRKMLAFYGKTENCCLVDAAFSTGCDEKSFVSIFGESAAEPPQPLPAAAAPPYIEAASSARKDGSPPHALHTTIQEPCADDTR